MLGRRRRWWWQSWLLLSPVGVWWVIVQSVRRRQRVGARDDLADLLGDLGLAGLVGEPGVHADRGPRRCRSRCAWRAGGRRARRPPPAAGSCRCGCARTAAAARRARPPGDGSNSYSGERPRPRRGLDALDDLEREHPDDPRASASPCSRSACRRRAARRRRPRPPAPRKASSSVSAISCGGLDASARPSCPVHVPRELAAAGTCSTTRPGGRSTYSDDLLALARSSRSMQPLGLADRRSPSRRPAMPRSDVTTQHRDPVRVRAARW